MSRAAETGRHHFIENRIPDPRPQTLGELVELEKAGGTLKGQTALFEHNRARAEEVRWERTMEGNPAFVQRGILNRIPAVIEAAKRYVARVRSERGGYHRPEVAVPRRRAQARVRFA